MSKPAQSILNKEFRYVNSANTNVAKTFAKARKQLAEQKEREAEAQKEAESKVRTLKGAGK